MKKITFLFTAVAAVLLAGSPAAKAVNLQLSAVTPLDTFTFDLIGITYDTVTGATAAASYLTTGSATFGVAATSTGPNGQVITMTSSETVGPVTTTDTFTISTPLNFLNTTTFGGNFINGIQFDLGDANSGGNSVALLLPITSYTATSSVTYGPTSTITTAIGNTTMLAANGSSYAFAEGVSSSPLTTAASAYAFRSFSYSITYPTVVPEPSTWAMLGFGIVVGAATIRRCRSEA